MSASSSHCCLTTKELTTADLYKTALGDELYLISDNPLSDSVIVVNLESETRFPIKRSIFFQGCTLVQSGFDWTEEDEHAEKGWQLSIA